MRISVSHLRKAFRPDRGAPVHAVDDVSLEVEDGEFLVILGPSGSGKTTLLRSIAGLERPDAGEIVVDGRIVYSSERHIWVPPDRRGISMVFQSYALWPHMTVFDNVAYPLRSRHAPKAQVQERVNSALELVGCRPLAARHPSQLSGGQQQRVALARAIVSDSRVVLFDEPLSSVDALVRDELRRELATLQRTLGFSSVYITHDQTEATVLGHRVAVLADGKIVQVGPPRELYSRPATRYVAEFMGAGNQFSGHVTAMTADGLQIDSELGAVVADASGPAVSVGQPVTLIVRPESVRLSDEQPSSATNSWPCTIERNTFLGFCTEYLVRVEGGTVYTRSMDRHVFDTGTTAWIAIDPGVVAVVPADVTATTA